MPKERQPFTPRGPFIVVRGFKWAGKHYKTNDPFPATRLAIDHRRLRQMWEHKRIEVTSDYLPEESEELPIEPDTGEGTDTKTTEETEVEAFVFNPKVHVIEKVDKETWIADDENLLVRIYADYAPTLEKAEDEVEVPEEKILERPDGDDEE